MSFVAVISRADHRWDFDGDSLDSIGSANGTDTSIDYPSTPICLGVTACGRTNATGDNISIASAADINTAALAQFYIGGWIQLSSKQGPPVCVWKAGTDPNRGIFTGVNNNNLVFQHDDGAAIVQNYSDFALKNLRNYYIGMRFDNGICDAFIDGVKQSISEPADKDTGSTTFPIHGSIDFGNLDSTTSIGGQLILIKAIVNCLYNEWHSFSGADIPSDAEIRQDLFEEKAFADVIITSGTESAMQTQIDGQADTLGNDMECDIEVQAVTGDGDLTLTLDNRTFDPSASIHVRYLGSGTLTLVNTNGSNASIVSGNVSIENPATLTINFSQAGSEIRIYDNNGSQNYLGDELDGIESSAGTSFAFLHAGTSNDIAVQIIKDGFQEILYFITLGVQNQIISFTQKAAVNE